MSTLCLHIGLPKTGSSAIQSFLSANIRRLDQAGVYYAQNVHTGTDSAIASSGNGRALVKYLDPKRRPARFDLPTFEQLVRDTYLSDAHPVSVVSSELLVSANKACLQAFRDRVAGPRRIVVLAVIRNIYDHALSSWNQSVKWHGYGRSFEHFARHEYTNAQVRAVAKYGRCLGLETIRLINYDAHRKDIVRPFLEAIGAPAMTDERAPTVNRSLTEAELGVQLMLNRLHRSRALAQEAAERFIARRPKAPSARLWRPVVARMLADRFAEDVADLAASLGADLGWMLQPEPRAGVSSSPLDYARAASDAAPVFAKAIADRWRQSAAA